MPETKDTTKVAGTISAFDTSLGTLTGVRVEYDLGLFAEASLQDIGNGGVFISSATGDVSVDFRLGDIALGMTSLEFDLACSGVGIADIPSCSSATDQATDGVLGSDSWSAADWLAATGGGDIDVTALLSVEADLLSASFFGSMLVAGRLGQIGASSDPQFDIFTNKLTVFYDYDESGNEMSAVPLPAGMPLLVGLHWCVAARCGEPVGKYG